MGVCNESGRKRNNPDTTTFNSNFSNTNKVDTSSYNKQIPSESSIKINNSLTHKALIPM